MTATDPIFHDDAHEVEWIVPRAGFEFTPRTVSVPQDHQAEKLDAAGLDPSVFGDTVDPSFFIGIGIQAGIRSGISAEGNVNMVQRLVQRLPPPADVEELELARWRSESRRLGARFHPSAMRISGHASGRAYRLATRWTRDGGAPRNRVGLEVVVEPGAGDPEEFRETFESDGFEDALATLNRALADVSVARSLYR